MSVLAFVFCSPRSGSTLLTRILNSHSKVAAPCEIMLPKYFEHDIPEAQALASEKFEIICQYYQADKEMGWNNYDYFVSTILQKENKQALVIKHPRYSLYLKQLNEDFPNAKFVYLVRDVRSVAASVFFGGNVLAGVNKWCQFNNAAVSQFQSLENNKKMLIRYEDIIASKHESIKKLINFLGYPFEPDMLEYGKHHHADDFMALWGGKSPADSLLQKKVSVGEIQSDVPVISEEVMKIFLENKTARALNKFFGYQE